MQKMLWNTGLLLILILGMNWQAAQAVSGQPNSAQFGYGARLKLAGHSQETLTQAVRSAAYYGLDWISCDYDWAAQSANPGEINLAALDAVMELAAQNGLYVLIPIVNAPAWSLTASGPDAEAVAALSIAMARRYGNTLQAIELFPAANTAQGWGIRPDPAAYNRLLQSTQAALQSAQLQVTLITAGLTPLPANPPPGDLDDLAFLVALYDAGGRDNMGVISLRLPAISDTPLASPTTHAPTQLRHFEAVRQIMLEHDHANGLIWISSFTWPEELKDPNAQAEWLVQAYEMLQARLYLGAAFFDTLAATDSEPALIEAGGQPHPGLFHLAQAITIRRAAASNLTHDLSKRLFPRPNFKPIF